MGGEADAVEIASSDSDGEKIPWWYGFDMSLMMLLLDVAGEQRGFITPQDAVRVGVPRVELPKMAARGVLEHRSHGVYRIPNFPVRRNDDLMEATLWAGGLGVISHESALELWGLADVNPRKINLTVGRRIRRAHGEAYRVWVADLSTADIDHRDDIPLTTVRRSILDAATTGTDPQMIEQALRNADRYDLVGIDEIAELRSLIEVQVGQ